MTSPGISTSPAPGRAPLLATIAAVYASFGDSAAGGNPAGVVISPEPLEGHVAQAIARTLCLPTTGFVTAPPVAGASPLPVRFFTTDQEIAACGHVTVAIATALVEHGFWASNATVSLVAKGGQYPLQLRSGRVEMTQSLKVAEPARIDWRDARSALGSTAAPPALPLEVLGTGLRHLIVPLSAPAQLAALDLNRERVAALARRAGADTICVWAPTGTPGHVRMRDLCAAIGDLEEPASGTTSAALALYLARNACRHGNLTVEQGIEMGRPSRIEVRTPNPETAVVSGTACRVLTGTLDGTGLGSFGHEQPWTSP